MEEKRSEGDDAVSVAWSGAVRDDAGRFRRVQGLVASRLLKLGLISPDLLPGEAELLGDLELRDILPARLEDSAAECQARLSDLLAGREIRIAGGDDGRHRISHLRIVTWVWPLPSVQHIRWPRNLTRCHALGCMAT